MIARTLALLSILAAGAHSGSAFADLDPDPWLDDVVAFEQGSFAGFGVDRLPHVVLGRPVGGGPLQGSTHVVSLGHGGAITVAFRDNVIFDGPGDDLVIFENAFHVGSEDGPLFTELAFVEVSADNRSWHAFAFDAESGDGLAGRRAVFAGFDAGIDPLEEAAGGDRFDLASVGLAFARYLRITDAGDELDDIGNATPPGGKGGFDLDAAAAIHSAPPAVISGSVRADGAAVARALVKLRPFDGGRRKRRRTADDGTFRFRNVLPSGAYVVRARSKGLGRDVREVWVDMEQAAAEVGLVLD